MKDFFPFKVIFEPARTFAGMAGTGWGWPLALYALSMTAAAALLAWLPPHFIAGALEGAALPPGRGFFFYLAVSLTGGGILTLFSCALLAAAARFLSAGRLALRLPLAAAAAGFFGIFSAAAQGSTALRPAGLAVAAAAALFAARAAWRDRSLFPSLLKALLALSALSLAGDLAGGLAALAGSQRAYAGVQYFFALVSLLWLAKAAAAVYAMSGARAMTAAVLALLGAMAALFLAFNLGLLPQDVFQVLLLL
ncbi:MAG: hypothetical protein CVU79_11705 [Elusimicrobia bacterium HGW-Elusimicrobia-3]|nr:MAG: hypothetical protein CVU79_11705 [Elusimicrobia bacterium HGW-Elusimicrobia-3]